MKSFIKKLTPSQLWLIFMAVFILVFTGSSALMAFSFSLNWKPHVTNHMILVYILLWLSVLLYGRAFHENRRMATLRYGLTAVFLFAFLTFIHLDDAPGQRVDHGDINSITEIGSASERAPWNEISLQVGHFRPTSKPLYWAASFNIACLMLFSLHFLWFGRKSRLLDHFVERLSALDPTEDDEGELSTETDKKES